MSDKELSGKRVTTAQKLRDWARGLKREILALYYAMKHPRTPWYAKVAAAVVVGYALSPIDLIPDFIPVLGYLDDVILLPIGIALVIRLIPPDVFESCRNAVAQNPPVGKPRLRAGAYVIVSLWLLAATGMIYSFWPSTLRFGWWDSTHEFLRLVLLQDITW